MKRPRPIDRHQQQHQHGYCGYLQQLTICLVSLVAAAAPCSAFVVPPFAPPLYHCDRLSRRLDNSPSTTFLSVTRKPVMSTSSFEALTVKELRDLVKQQTSEERGVLSRLKRKQDLIDYLVEAASEQHQTDQPTTESHVSLTSELFDGNQEAEIPRSEAAAVSSSSTSARAITRTTPTKLPSLSQTTASSSPAVNNRNPTPKDIIIQDVFRRYPPVREATEALQQEQLEAAATAQAITDASESSDSTDENTYTDMRQIYHPLLQACRNVSSSSDMDIVFVGTASCTPGVTRGVSCTALRLNWKRRGSLLYNAESGRLEPPRSMTDQQGFQGGTWLFDVGECTQLQVQRTSCIRPSKITKIFLTHAHGDHSFGLPGLLCLMGQDRDRNSTDIQPIDIYGPEGLRMWLRVAIRYSVSRIVPPYRVHEIMNVPMAPEWEYSPRARRFFRRGWTGDEARKPWKQQGLAGEDGISWISQAKRLDLEPSSMYGEIEGGRDIYPIYDHPLSSGGAPVWEVEDEEDVKVYAAPMSHGIPCLGYVVEELPRPGRLRNELVEPMVKRNFAALKNAGFKVPMKAMAVIKNLPSGSAFTFPDGSVVTQEDALEPARPGRKVVICGDTADSRSLLKLARNADVVIHEATNSYLTGVDKDTNLRDVTREAVLHGHSTPHLAGQFARAVKAQRLVLNHFSARYKGDISADSLSIMLRIERQAMKASMLNETQVAAAWDLMVLPVPRQK